MPSLTVVIGCSLLPHGCKEECVDKVRNIKLNQEVLFTPECDNINRCINDLVSEFRNKLEQAVAIYEQLKLKDDISRIDLPLGTLQTVLYM